MAYPYLKFTGDYAKLKSMGYTFCKLFAANYMAWSKGGMFIYKKGAEVTDGNLDLGKFMLFMEAQPLVRDYGTGISFFKFYTNVDENEYDYHPWSDENRQRIRDSMVEWADWNEDSGEPAPKYLGDSFQVSKKKIAQLEELKALGWIEVAYMDDHGNDVDKP